MPSIKWPTSEKKSHSPLRYAAVGVGVVAIAWLGLKPPAPIEPQGPLAESLISEIKAAASAAGIDTSTMRCQMHGNVNFGVSCKVSPYAIFQAAERLKAAGWQRTDAPPLAKDAEHAPFVKEGTRLSLDAEASKSHWAISASKSR